ncbi:unnamed protein product [Rotaria sp. Silwood1]|nr:unnamed protein product [Rotaria sp. Silwood1]
MLNFPHPNQKLLPDQIQCVSPAHQSSDPKITDRLKGSLLGLAVGDALGASVEFRPRQYLVDHPIANMQSGGTWGLQAGQWTDDTSMALCLASSLISRKEFDPYDQLVRYKWWYKHGYLSSTGRCFDIGNATHKSLDEFCRRQNECQRRWGTVSEEQMDSFSYEEMRPSGFDVNCGGSNANGNGALMRLAPVPLFFYREPAKAVEFSGQSARLTHGDPRAIDACRYYGALIVAAIHGESKEKLLDPNFYSAHRAWFGRNELHREVLAVASGSFKQKDGYSMGIRGSGQSVKSLEAALWAFWSDEQSFAKGVLKAVNLGDDTDTTGAIYGQLAGAYYGSNQIPQDWTQKLYAKNLISCIAEWLQVLGNSRSPAQPSQQQLSGDSRFPAQPSQQQVSENSRFPVQTSQQQVATRMSPPTGTQHDQYNKTHQNLSRVVSNPTHYLPVINPHLTKKSIAQNNIPTRKPGPATNKTTSKTLLAKAVANQTSATFLRVVGSELIQKYLGDGPKLVRELFRVAEEYAPAIVFIDEIDAIGTKRYESNSGGEREIQRTMLELLNQLDGFDSRGDVKVIMATNRIDSLDPALIRPGRIDRKIEFPLPDEKTRRMIFKIHTGRMTLADDVNLEELIMAKDDLSGADIKAICTESGLMALRERRMKVTNEDFRKSKETVLYRKNQGTPEGLYL